MYLFKKFISTIKYYLSGKGNPLRLIIVWWFLLNIFSFIFGFLMMGIFAQLCNNPNTQYLGAFLSLILSALGFIIAIIYPIIFIISVWRCAKNTNSSLKLFITRLFIIPFSLIHIYFLGLAYLVGAMRMLLSFLETLA